MSSLISYKRISNEVNIVIERIRVCLNSRIETGKVTVSGRINFDDVAGRTIPEPPTVGIFALSPQCDATIVDDRFINQYKNIQNDGSHAPILSTLDVIDSLVAMGVISGDDQLECRTQLRRAGYFYIPISEEELERCLRASDVVYGKIVETAELKAIRESILRVRMSDWLQLPTEASWMIETLRTLTRVLKSLWKDGADVEDVTARSNWLAEQLDIRGWVHRFLPENADHFARIGQGAHIILLLTPPPGAQQDIEDQYCSWVEGKILVPIKEEFPDLYSWLIEAYRGEVARIVETEFSENDNL